MSATAIQPTSSVGVLAIPLTGRDWVRVQRWPLLATAALVVTLYAANFAKLFSDWSKDANYSHGFLVPVAFAWILWQRRQGLANSRVVPNPWGMALVVLALLQLIAGTLGAEYFVAHSSFLVLLVGITLFLFGSEVLRQVLFPIGWLLFMIPLPAIIFYSVTFPLQLLASQFAAGLLDLLRVPNLREGNVLYLANFTVGVVEACSGIRSLISLLAFAVLIGHFFSMSTLARWVLAFSAVPIALGINAVRVAGTGVAGNYWGAQWAQGFFHTFSGWVLFVGAIVLMLGVAQILKRFAPARTFEAKA